MATMTAAGHPMMVTDGARSTSEQGVLWAKGRTYQNGRWRITGRVATYCDGVIKRSNHQSGRAADCCFVVDGKPSWAESLPWQDYADAAMHEGLQAGYYWRRQDKPHIELPPDPKDQVLKA